MTVSNLPGACSLLYSSEYLLSIEQSTSGTTIFTRMEVSTLRSVLQAYFRFTLQRTTLPAPTGSAVNFGGNTFSTQDTVTKTEAGRAYDYDKERRWRIINLVLATRYTLGVKGGCYSNDGSPGFLGGGESFVLEEYFLGVQRYRG